MTTETKTSTRFGTLIATEDGSLTVKHAGHGQEFHSTEGAKFEAWQLYVVASGFLSRLKAHEAGPIAVLDVGMGLGYNAAATIAAWLACDDPVDVELRSLEIDAELVATLAGGLAPWCEGWESSWLTGPKCLTQLDANHWRANVSHPNGTCALHWSVDVGDASQRAIAETNICRGYEFVWQDPFTPELNPSMWSDAWFARVRDASHKDVRLMTYSVARVVRDALNAAGWSCERISTPGKKRHWLKAFLPVV